MAERTGNTGRLLAAATAAVFLLSGCHTSQSFKERFEGVSRFVSPSYDDPRAGERLEAAERLYAEKDYDRAADLFKQLADNTRNHAELAERARFMQAECRRMRGEYPAAVDTYHKLLLDFPAGAHRREACVRVFEIADFWLDDFRAELASREGEKGVLRWRPRWPNPLDKSKPPFDQEGRALEALEHVHTHDITGPTADKALFWCGYVNFIRGNFGEADHFFSQLVEIHKDSPLRPQAVAFAIQAKNNATGGAVYDGRKCAEALHLVHVAEGTVPELAHDPVMAEKLAKAKFAIRYQQAEKDFKTAEYYERTGHAGSAVFYYELVRRRYAGTWYADLATQRKDTLVKLVGEGKSPPGYDPIARAQAKWTELFGEKKADPDAPPDPRRTAPPVGPNPAILPAGGQPGPGGINPGP